MTLQRERSSSIPPPSAQAYLESLGFVVGRPLGSGATATVHAAWHHQLGDVALKVGRHRTAAPAFRHERAVLDRLSHPGIPDAHLYVVDPDGLPLLVLTRLRGSMPHRQSSPQDAVSLALSVLAILDHVHRRGIVHCDLKRHNLLVDHRAQLFDFGVAKRVGQCSTDTLGRVAGTPAYMAPEVLTGQVVDERTDLYSLGVLLYFDLTGRFPFPTDRGLHLSSKRRLSWIPPSVLRADLHEDIDEVLRSMLAPRRVNRPTTDEVGGRLRALLPGLSRRMPTTLEDLRDSGTTEQLPH